MQTQKIVQPICTELCLTSSCLLIGFRVGVVVVVAIGVGLIPMVMQAQGDQLFVYIQNITAYFSPPIAAVYLVAIIWPRSNEKVSKYIWFCYCQHFCIKSLWYL